MSWINPLRMLCSSSVLSMSIAYMTCGQGRVQGKEMTVFWPVSRGSRAKHINMWERVTPARLLDRRKHCRLLAKLQNCTVTPRCLSRYNVGESRAVSSPNDSEKPKRAGAHHALLKPTRNAHRWHDQPIVANLAPAHQKWKNTNRKKSHTLGGTLISFKARNTANSTQRQAQQRHDYPHCSSSKVLRQDSVLRIHQATGVLLDRKVHQSVFFAHLQAVRGNPIDKCI